jgi:hypothetical protein
MIKINGREHYEITKTKDSNSFTVLFDTSKGFSASFSDHAGFFDTFLSED